MKTPSPMEICLEDLDASADDERYLRCVALPGGEPGLTLNRRGAVRWMPDGPAAYELWVSGDGRLVVFRNPGSPAVVVRRSGRSLEAPEEKPVLLLDQDLLEVSGRRMRVHVHGEAEEVHEPEFLSARSLARMARAAAAALALGTAVGAAGPAQGAPGRPAAGGEAIEVRQNPPGPKVMRRKPYRCSIVSLTADAKGRHLLRLSCPKGAKVTAGLRGQVLDPKTNKAVKNGRVVVIKAVKNLVVARTRLKKLGGAKTVLFLISP